jgi:DNA-binding transcriptional ArsR family regulator
MAASPRPPLTIAKASAILADLARDIEALDERPATISEIRRAIREEMKRELPNRDPITVTKREAARLLRVDRKTTLAKLIDAGAIRTVPWPGGDRIPRSEVERLAREGIREPGRNRAKPRPLANHSRRQLGSRIAAEIRALDLKNT